MGARLEEKTSPGVLAGPVEGAKLTDTLRR